MFSLSNGDLCELFEGIHSSGGHVSLVAGQIRVDGASLLSVGIVAAIRENKTQLIQVLSRSAGLTCPYCGAAQIAVPTFDGFENFECFSCGQCSGCRAGQTRLQIPAMQIPTSNSRQESDATANPKASSYEEN